MKFSILELLALTKDWELYKKGEKYIKIKQYFFNEIGVPWIFIPLTFSAERKSSFLILIKLSFSLSLKSFLCESIKYKTCFLWDLIWSNILKEKFQILYAGILSGGLAFVLQIYAQKNISPAPSAIIFSLEGVFATIAAWILLNQILDINNLFGCLFILFGVLFSQLAPILKKN